jgi:pentatricopeptide repeat protein
VDAALDKADIRGVTTTNVEQVLRLSYAHPCAAAAFFHLAGHWHLGHDNHSPYSWNLVIDILGTNRIFTRMWETVDSMHSRWLLSLDTFASVFSSLAASPSCSMLKAFMDDMPHYDMACDTTTLNSLLSALCRANRLDDARAVILVARAEVGTLPDADSYAILLECARLPPTRGLHETCSTKWCVTSVVILTMCLPMMPSSLRLCQATTPWRYQKQRTI